MPPNFPLYSQSRILESRHYQDIEKAAPEVIIVLYRGCNETDANKMRDAMTAGGALINEDCGPPDEDDVIGQVGEGVYKKDGKGGYMRVKLPEFTHDIRSMMMDRVKVPDHVVMGVVQIWIRRHYIVRGDAGCMNGWCARYEAPIERWEFKARAKTRN